MKTKLNGNSSLGLLLMVLCRQRKLMGRILDAIFQILEQPFI